MISKDEKKEGADSHITSDISNDANPWLDFPCLQQWDSWAVLNLDKKVPATRIMILCLTIGLLLSLNKSVFQTLTATVLTVFVETKILKMLSSLFMCDGILWGVSFVLTCGYIGTSIELRRGTYYLTAFVLFVGFCGQIVTLIIFVSYYYIAFDTYYLETPLCGFGAVMSGLSVALVADSDWKKQQLVNIRMTRTGLNSGTNASSQWSLTCQYLPFLVVCMHLLFVSLRIELIENACLGICGVYCAWFYLRFFALSENGEKGNSDESFAVHMLCPPILRFPVHLIAKCAFAIAEQLGCCQQHTTSKLKPQIAELTRVRVESNNTNADLQTEVPLYEDLDPTKAYQRKEAKKLIETRLAELKKEIDSRALDQASKS